MNLLSAEQVRELLLKRVRIAGSQRALANSIGARSTDINNALQGRRLPVRVILRALKLRKVPIYEHEGETLRTEDVTCLVKQAIEATGSQLAWAKAIGGRQPDVNNLLQGRREPSQTILDAFGLKKRFAYEHDHHARVCE